MTQEDMYVIGTMLAAGLVLLLVILKIKKKDPIQHITPAQRKQIKKAKVYSTKQYVAPLEHNDSVDDEEGSED